MVNFWKKLLAELQNYKFKSKENPVVTTIILEPDEELDMAKILDLDEQKDVCSTMFGILKTEELRIKNRLIITHTVTDLLDSDENIRSKVGEYVGYHFGSMSHNMMMVSSAMKNLKRFQDGHLDKVDPQARGMYVTIWYNIARSNIDLVEGSMGNLEALESDLVEQEMGSEDAAIKRGTLH